MTLRQRFERRLAQQLGRPAGLFGHVVGRRLNKRNRRPVTAAVKLLEPQPGSVVADVGFGGGVGLEQLLDSPAATVHGVEISHEMLRAARRRFKEPVAAGRLVLSDGSLTRLPLPDDSLDGLVTTNTIYFVDDLAAAAAELARVLKPGGRAAVGIGDPDWMTRLPPTAYGFRLRPVDEVVATLAGSGLTLADHQRLGEDEVRFHIMLFR